MNKKNGSGKRAVKDLPARKSENIRGGWSLSGLPGTVAAPTAPKAPKETIALPYAHIEYTYTP